MSGNFQSARTGSLGIRIETGVGVLKILSNPYLPTNFCASYQVRSKPLWRIPRCPWLRSFSLQTPEGAVDPLHPTSSVSLPPHPQSPGGQGWALNFKQSFTSPFPSDSLLPSARPETNAKTVSGAPTPPAPLAYTRLSPPPQAPAGRIFPTCLAFDKAISLGTIQL